MKWFKHDACAGMDAKLKKLRLRYGLEGYGLYWYLLECIARTVEPHNLTYELEEDSELLAAELNMNREQVEEMMLFMVDLSLFEQTDGIVSCLKLRDRSDEYTQKLLRKVGSVRTISGPAPEKVPPIRTEQNRTDKNRTETTTTSPAKAGNRPPVQEIVDLYHEILPDNPRVMKITDTRRSLIKQRWQTDLKTLDNWRNYFEHVSQSYFLTGRAQPQPGKPVFFADLEWLIRPSNLVKVAEGKYHREVANVR